MASTVTEAQVAKDTLRGVLFYKAENPGHNKVPGFYKLFVRKKRRPFKCELNNLVTGSCFSDRSLSFQNDPPKQCGIVRTASWYQLSGCLSTCFRVTSCLPPTSLLAHLMIIVNKINPGHIAVPGFVDLRRSRAFRDEYPLPGP